MPIYSISKSFHWNGQITDKVAQVCRMFGLTVDRLRKNHFNFNCRLQINDGDIVYITGPSGAGKSVLLCELEKSIPPADRINLAEIKLPEDKTLIDCISELRQDLRPDGDGDFLSCLRTLSTAGLNDVFSILNQPANLSEGQQYRFRLAMALALVSAERTGAGAGKKFIFADEFCSNLDRITAAVISHNIHKFAKRNSVTFVLAASNDDILLDLAPDVLVVQELSGETQVIYKKSGVRSQNLEVRM